MHRLSAQSVILSLLFVSFASAQEAARSEETAPSPTKAEMKKAESAFKRALRLQSEPENTDNLTHALESLEESRALNPQEPTYATTYEFVRQQLIAAHLEKGDKLLQLGLIGEAQGEFREVLTLDPNHPVARERLQSTGQQPAGRAVSTRNYSLASEPILAPKAIKAPFDFHGDSRQLFATIGKTFGVVVLFDDSVPVRSLRFQLEEADFYSTMRAAGKATGTFWMAMSQNQVLVAPDNADARRRLERMSLRTYELSNLSSAQELADIVNLLRAMLDVRFVIADQAASTITVRAPGETIRAIDSLIADLAAAKPEVMLDIHAYQLNRTMSRNIGVGLPLQFTLFNFGTEARALLKQSNNQALIDSLIATGAVSASDAAAIAAALAAQSGSVFLQPFAVFGGGKTLTGLVVPPLSLKLDYSKSTATSIQQITLRASQASAATLRIGDRIPVLTSQYAPLISIPGRPSTNFTGIIPSYNYEDLGITLKATPRVTGSHDVVLQVELAIKALNGESFNNVPTISERQYTGTITVKEGESSILAGSINVQETNTISGLPWLSRVPLLGHAVGMHGKQDAQSELLFIITPHIVRGPRPAREATEVVLGH